MNYQINSFYQNSATMLVILCLTFVFATDCMAFQSLSISQSDTTTSKYAYLEPLIREAIESGYYAPQEFSQPRWKQFWINLSKALAESDSDRELSQKFREAAWALGVSHLSLYRDITSNKDETPSGNNSQHVTLEFKVNSIAVLTVHGTFSVNRTLKPLTKAFKEIVSKQPKALIIDLRHNPGGDLSSMLLVGHLIDKPTTAGLFLSRTWWQRHDTVPPRAHWDSLPHLIKPNLQAFHSALKKRGALVGVIPPMKPHYAGPVYVLTGPITASASEPVVYLLKQTGRATIVGKRTAGSMLSSNIVELSDGWMLQYPEADFYTPQMTRIDQVGVKPAIVVPVEKALDKALELARE